MEMRILCVAFLQCVMDYPGLYEGLTKVFVLLNVCNRDLTDCSCVMIIWAKISGLSQLLLLIQYLVLLIYLDCFYESFFKLAW